MAKIIMIITKILIILSSCKKKANWFLIKKANWSYPQKIIVTTLKFHETIKHRFIQSKSKEYRTLNWSGNLISKYHES